MKSRCFVLIASIFAFVPSLILAAGSIEVKDLKGRAMTVEVLAFTESSKNVKIKRVPDGAIFTVKADIFDAESQKRIVEAAPKARANLLIKVPVGRRRKNVPGSSYMETQTITAKVQVENDSRDVDMTGGKGTIFLIAQQTKRFADRAENYGKVLAKETFDISVAAGQEFEYECDPVVTEYDSDRDSTNIGGWEYYGWLLVIQDSDGDVQYTETNIGNLKKETEDDPSVGENYLSLRKDQEIEKNLTDR